MDAPEFEDETLVAWYQTDYGRQLVELLDEPERHYAVPPKGQSWVRVKCQRFSMNSGTPFFCGLISGTEEVLVLALHPITPAARELLSIVPPKVDWKGRWL